MNPDNISLRDHFAGLAMQAIVGRMKPILFSRTTVIRCESLSEASYLLADAMLAEREKGNKQV